MPSCFSKMFFELILIYKPMKNTMGIKSNKIIWPISRNSNNILFGELIKQ